MNMKKRWQDMVTLLLGVWLIVSPFILPRTLAGDVLFDNSVVVGNFVVWAALFAIYRPNAWKEWVLVVLGSWLIASSYLFGDVVANGYFTALAMNQLIVGLLILVDASFGLYRRQAIRDMDKRNIEKPKAA